MNSLAASEPSTTDFEARIVDRDDREIILDQTYFYPESGGQPADRGEIDGSAVVDVQDRCGEVVHVLTEEIDAGIGETAVCSIDPVFRTYCMRTHTASHVLYGAGRKLLDDLGYGGFDIDERKARIDFETTTEIDDSVLVELEVLANRAVWESHPVSWETIPVEKARAREEVAFNTKTEEGVFGEAEGVRVVTVEGNETRDPAAVPWDSAACGGTHVQNTHEIGFISVLSRSNPGEGLTRVELAVGPAAIDHRIDTRTAVLSAARELDVRVSDLSGAIERQHSELAQLESERDDLLNRVADAQLDAVGDPIEHDDERWFVASLSGVDSDTLSDRARGMAGESAELVALVTESTPATVVVASVGETDAGSVVEGITTEFGGGGGGGSEFAQGGGIAAEPNAIVASLRKQ